MRKEVEKEGQKVVLNSQVGSKELLITLLSNSSSKIYWL